MDPYQPPEESRPAPQPASSYNVKHHDIGGVLDQTVSLVKDHFFSLFKVVAIVLVPVNLLSAFLVLGLMPPQPPMGAPPEQSQQYFQELLKVFEDNIPLLLVIILVNMIANPIAHGAVIHTAANLYLGKQVTLGQSLQVGVRRILSFWGLGILYGMLLLVGMIPCGLGAIFFSIVFCLAQQCLVIEKVGPIDALSRSYKLVWPEILTACVLSVIIFAIAFSVGFGGALVPNQYVQYLLQTLVQLVILVFTTATFVVFYFSCRCGLENFDLQHMTEAIESDGSSPGGSDRLDDGTNFFGQPE